MKVTLITATYNSEKNIKTCLDSVTYQNFKNIEHLIIDGNSSDNTLSIINVYQQNYPFIKVVSEEDEGIYDALNKGINLASGDIIGFVHSDDFLQSTDILNDIVSMIISQNLDGVYGDLQYIDKNNPQKVFRNWKSCEFNKSLLRKGWMPPHPTLFLRREVYEKHGFFDLYYKISADYDFMLRVFNDSELKFGYLPKVITRMRVGGASNRNLKNIILKTKEDYRAIKRNNIGNFTTLITKNTSKLKQFF